MTIFVEYKPNTDVWEVDRAGGIGVLFTKPTRQAAIAQARRYREKGEDIAVKGPRMNSFKSV